MLQNNSTLTRSLLSRNAAVASSDPIATATGVDILKRGGNAADAAVAVAAVLNFVHPTSTGVGGDCFCMFYDNKTKSVKGINGSGRSSSALTLEKVKEHFSSSEKCIPHDNALSVTVPGATAGWIDTVETFGSGNLSLSEILEPAIKLCENGYPSQKFSSYLQQEGKDRLICNEKSFGGDLLIDGESPCEGDMVYNKHLANVFKEIAGKGKRGFYEGWIAQQIVDCVQSNGGCLSLEDMKNHESTFDVPISATYKGLKIWEMPPNGQGLIALMALNIVKYLDLDQCDDRDDISTFHRLIEAIRLAAFDGATYICDPSKKDMPVTSLLSDEYAMSRAKLIQKDKILDNLEPCSLLNFGSDTVYLSVVDCDGNACSFINSIYCLYGCGLVPKDCGFALHCRGSNFSLDRNHPNVVGPGKRSFHTIIPGMVTYNDTNELYACFGNMGGFMQPQGHLQLLVNLIDYNMDPQSAICYPRFKIGDFTEATKILYIEESVQEVTQQELKKLGYEVHVVKDMKREMFGRAQIIQIRKDKHGNKVLWSGTETRADGCVIGY